MKIDRNCYMRLVRPSKKERQKIYMNMNKKELVEMHIQLEDLYFHDSMQKEANLWAESKTTTNILETT